MNNTHTVSAPYSSLTPEVILDAVEQTGHRASGSLLALNSYENRVYQVGVEEEGFLVAKFYRPGRWSDAAILEEHAFALELAADEVPMVPPLQDTQGHTLHQQSGFRFATYPRRGGRWPELDNVENLQWLGRFIARIHQVGSVQAFRDRPTLTIERMGEESLRFLLEAGLIPRELEHNYRNTAEAMLSAVRLAFEAIGPVRKIRLHGDCHPGNILWTDKGPHFVDLDDCQMGPAIQDLWMLLSGDSTEMAAQLRGLLAGYEEFREFDLMELGLIEPLRALRLIHYSAWLARRWGDPAFPQHFPWFNTPRYWEDQLNTLREQNERLEQPTLSLST